MKRGLLLLVIAFSAICTYAQSDSLLLSKARQAVESGNYEYAISLYDSLSHKMDLEFKSNYGQKVVAAYDEYKLNIQHMENVKATNRMLFISLISLLSVAIVAIIIYFFLMRRINSLNRSTEELENAKKMAKISIMNKSTVISNMSHEIRTPLNALVGFSSFIVDNPTLDKESMEQFNNIIKLNSDLLLKLLNDVIDISCLDYSNMKFNIEEYDAIKLGKELTETFEKIKHTDVVIKFDSSLNTLMVETDLLKLQQVVMNLIANAIKFCKVGTITLKIELKDSSTALFSVSDTGSGVPVEQREEIFNRFNKLDENIQGTGLGLSISRLILKNLGGEIWVDGSYNQGARFVFTHPLKQN